MVPEQDGPLRTHSVEHCPQVVHAHLEGGRLPKAIGKPAPRDGRT